MADATFPESPRLQQIRLSEVPVTAAVGVIATIVTAIWLLGGNIDWAFLDFRFWHGEPWRILTSVFPHVDPLHLFFNLYWLWKMGALVEIEYGSLRTAALYIFLGIVSSCAEFAYAAGGVGLSGIGYGLFGFLLVLRKEREAFARVINFRNSFMFVGWFFLCIALTKIRAIPIGNTAHGSGAIAGLLCGAAVRFPGMPRSLAVAGITLSLIGSLAGASVFRTAINPTNDVYLDLVHFGYEAELRKDYPTATEYFRASIKKKADVADTWFRLARVLHEQNDLKAADAYFSAWKLAPDIKEYKDIAYEFNVFAAQDAVTRTFDADRAAKCFKRAVEIDSSQSEIWEQYAAVLHQLGRIEEGKTARAKAAELLARKK